MAKSNATAPTPLSNGLGQNAVYVTVDLSVAAWNTVATHEVFTVTGLVKAIAFYRVTENAAAGAGALISFGREGSTTTFAAAQLFSNLVAGNFIQPGGTTSAFMGFDTYQAVAGALTVIEGLDLGYEITVNAFTDGTLEAVCFWTPISAGSRVVAGTGAAL